MHGRPRDYKHKLSDPKVQEAYSKKVEAIRKGTGLVLACHATKRYDAAALDTSAKLLKVVPEIYTLWNFRREALASAFAEGGPVAQAASQGELALTHACLAENPKSYSTWHHRKWVVRKGLCSLNAELALITQALDQDARNFHAWHYRQFIVGLMGRPASAELAYSEDKIAQNFSNYSAWHYRTILLPRLHCMAAEGAGLPEAGAMASAATHPQPGVGGAGLAQPAAAAAAAQPPPPAGPALVPSQRGSSAGGGGSVASVPGPGGRFWAAIPAPVLDEEYDFVQAAFATDSEDQAPWMYYRWLMGNSLAHLEEARGTPHEAQARTELKAVLEREILRFEEDHIAEAPDARWPLLTVARLREAQARLHLSDRPTEEVLAQVHATFDRLIELDPMRRGYYQDARDGKASVVVQALGMRA